MATFKINIYESKKERTHKIEIKVSKEMNFIRLIDALNRVFEIEMHYANVSSDREFNCVTLTTSNYEKAKALRESVIQLAFPHNVNNQN